MCLYFCSIPCNCDEILPSKYWSFEWILCMGVHSQGGRQLPPGKLALSLVICFRNSDASIACLWTVWLSLDAQCAHSVHEHCNDNTVLQVCDSCQFLRYAVIISLHIVLLWMQQVSFLAVTTSTIRMTRFVALCVACFYHIPLKTKLLLSASPIKHCKSYIYTTSCELFYISK